MQGAGDGRDGRVELGGAGFPGVGVWPGRGVVIVLRPAANGQWMGSGEEGR